MLTFEFTFKDVVEVNKDIRFMIEFFGVTKEFEERYFYFFKQLIETLIKENDTKNLKELPLNTKLLEKSEEKFTELIDWLLMQCRNLEEPIITQKN